MWLLSVAGVQGISKKVAAIEITINGPGFAHLLHLMVTMIQIDDDHVGHIVILQGHRNQLFTYLPSTPKKSIIIKNAGKRTSIYTIFTSGDLALPQAMWPFQLQEEQKGSIRNVSTVSPLVCETFTIKYKIILNLITIKSQKLYSGCQGRQTKKWQFHFLRTLLRKSAQTAKRTILPWNGIDHIWENWWRHSVVDQQALTHPSIFIWNPKRPSQNLSPILDHTKRGDSWFFAKKKISLILYIIRERRTHQVNTQLCDAFLIYICFKCRFIGRLEIQQYWKYIETNQ